MPHLPVSAASSAGASTAASARVVIATLPDVACPAWRFPSEAPPAGLASAVAALPAGAALFAPVCVPFFSERGPSLRRSLEALALQQEDLGGGAVLHVFAIGDGWRSPGGGRVLS